MFKIYGSKDWGRIILKFTAQCQNYGTIIKVCNSSKSISFHLMEIIIMYSINDIKLGGGVKPTPIELTLTVLERLPASVWFYSMPFPNY